MPGRLTRTDVERIAALARLALTEEERALYARQLARVIDFVQQLDEVDLAGATLDSPALDAPLERHDEVRPGLGSAAALANAPETADGLFKVPRAIDEP